MIALMDTAATPLARLPTDRLERPHSVDCILQGERPDVVVTGPGDPDPVRTSQRVRHLDVAVPICVPAARMSDVENALCRVPQPPTDLKVVQSDDPGKLAAEVRLATERSKKRQRHAAKTAAPNRSTWSATHAAQAVPVDRLLEIAPIGILTADAAGSVQAWNAQAAEFFKECLHVGSSVYSLFDAPGRDTIRALLHTEDPLPQARLTARNGLYCLDVRFGILHDGDGGFQSAAHCLRRDGTGARRRTESRKPRTFGVILEGAPVGLGYLDRHLRFQRVNRTLAEINGLTSF